MSIHFEGSSEWCTALRLANTLQIFLRKCKFWCVTTTYINDEMMMVMWYKGKVILKIVSSWWVGHISASTRGFRDTVNSKESQLSVSTDAIMSALRSLCVQLTPHSQMHCRVTWPRRPEPNKQQPIKCNAFMYLSFLGHITSFLASFCTVWVNLNLIVDRMLNCNGKKWNFFNCNS